MGNTSILPAYDTVGYVFLEIKHSFSILKTIPGHSPKVSQVITYFKIKFNVHKFTPKLKKGLNLHLKIKLQNLCHHKIHVIIFIVQIVLILLMDV